MTKMVTMATRRKMATDMDLITTRAVATNMVFIKKGMTKMTSTIKKIKKTNAVNTMKMMIKKV